MTSAIAPVLTCEGLAVHYGRAVVLDQVTLAVPRGSVYALLGRNGSGKTSLVRCLLGQRRPSAGTMTLLGRDPWKARRELMARVGVVPEEPDAPPEMTAAQILAFGARLYERWDSAAAGARLARFGTPANVPFQRLSKGQKGSVMLTLALAHGPEVLILDDPTLGLDLMARQAVFSEVIGELADHGTTVFITTHDLSAIEGVADRIGILKDGRLVVDDALESLKAAHQRPLEEIFAATLAVGGRA